MNFNMFYCLIFSSLFFTNLSFAEPHASNEDNHSQNSELPTSDQQNFKQIEEAKLEVRSKANDIQIGVLSQQAYTDFLEQNEGITQALPRNSTDLQWETTNDFNLKGHANPKDQENILYLSTEIDSKLFVCAITQTIYRKFSKSTLLIFFSYSIWSPRGDSHDFDGRLIEFRGVCKNENANDVRLSNGYSSAEPIIEENYSFGEVLDYLQAHGALTE